jgi:hypothetical protein
LGDVREGDVNHPQRAEKGKREGIPEVKKDLNKEKDFQMRSVVKMTELILF